jgi:hypothetical protein
VGGGLLAVVAASPRWLDGVAWGVQAPQRSLVRSVLAQHLGTVFAVRQPTGDLRLRLAAVSDHPWAGGAADGSEDRFVASFTGPAGALAQDTYELRHRSLGTMTLFLVPTRPAADGTGRYEAVFNRI